MANDRLMLICGKCRQFVTLAAVSAITSEPSIRGPSKHVREFVEHHWYACEHGGWPITFEGLPGFELGTETGFADRAGVWKPERVS